jgi:hypothetical protein
MQEAEQQNKELVAQTLRWKTRAYGIAAAPFGMVVGYQIGAEATFLQLNMLPTWIVAVSATAGGVLMALSAIASSEHKKLTGKYVWW